MRYFCVIILILYLAGCAAAPDKTDKAIPLEMPKMTIKEFSSTEKELENKIGSLNKYIGSYPPRIGTAIQREQVYQNWSEAIAEAKAYHLKYGDTEKALFFLSELYRQGHNLDVTGSAERADTTVEQCLKKFPSSKSCHFSAAYFYLSVGSVFLDKAEKSLYKLRQIYYPSKNSEVEAGYAFLYLYRRDRSNAIKQINSFLEMFPNQMRAQDFEKIKEALENTESIEYRNR